MAVPSALKELVAKFRDRNVKGEATIVIEGNRDKSAGDEESEDDPDEDDRMPDEPDNAGSGAGPDEQ